jgi:tetratricopeptide (TPR) repeat protein
MNINVIVLKCPHCGGVVSQKEDKCEWCGSPFIISSFNPVYSISMSETRDYISEYKKAIPLYDDQNGITNSIAICNLKLRLYKEALSDFEKIIRNDFNNSETYFYAAICLLEGKKAFLANRTNIDKAEKYLDAAISIEPDKGIYYYLYAYIKYDYFERKNLNTTPYYSELLKTAQIKGVSEYDKKMLFDILNVSKPSVL